MSQFNLSPFNLGTTVSDEIRVFGKFSASLGAVYSTGVNLEASMSASSALATKQLMTLSFPLKIRVAEDVWSHYGGAVGARIKEDLQAYVGAKVVGVMDLNAPEVEAEGGLKSSQYLAVDVTVPADALKEDLRGELYASKDLKLTTNLFASSELMAYLSSVILDFRVISIAVSLPPGGRVELNAEDYTLYIDGVNAQHVHSGYWPHLSRKTVQMDVTNGNNAPLDGFLIYQERYL